MKFKKCGKYLKMLFKDCFHKLYDKNIMTQGTSIKSLKKNEKLFNEITIDNRIAIMSATQEIWSHNPDFTEIGINYIVDSDKIINSRNLYNYVKNYDDEYYFYKALSTTIIICLLIIIQSLFSIIAFYPKYKCIDVPIESFEKRYWINSGKFFKVVEKKIIILLLLKIVYFILFEGAYIINELYFFKNFERIKVNKKIVLIYQTFGYILTGVFYVFKLIDKNNCINSMNDKNIFYKDYNLLEIILSIFFDLTKFLIISISIK